MNRDMMLGLFMLAAAAVLAAYGQLVFRRGWETRSSSAVPHTTSTAVLTHEQEALLRAIDRYQVQFATAKIVIARNGDLLLPTNGSVKRTGVNIVSELFGEVPPPDGSVHAGFVTLMESLPTEYVHFFSETRFGSPFVISVTLAGRRYLRNAAPSDRPPEAPVPAESAPYVTLNGRTVIALPRDATEGSKYEQWVAQMRMANRDGQLVGVVVDFRRPAARFDSDEKFIFPKVLPKYLDVEGNKKPLVDEDYVQFEFLPAQDGRRIRFQAAREGVLAIEVWRSWDLVPWDWLLVEAYSSLVCLQDDRILRLFQSPGIMQAALTLGNLVGRGGVTTDSRVTTRGLRVGDLMAPDHEVLGEWPRNPAVQYECGSIMKADPWDCAKAFVKRALIKTGVLQFEKRLEAVNKDIFLNLYFETPGEFRRPPASAIREG